MTLIKSISGIRGTIGGAIGDNFTPNDIVECTAAYGYWLLQKNVKPRVVVGRDARISGEIVSGLVVNTLRALGITVIDLGLSTTPTVEIAVPLEGAGGGIILTASHNPKQWNALKFLNEKGEFISAQEGEDILKIIASKETVFAEIDALGGYIKKTDYVELHINMILDLILVDRHKIRQKQYRVIVDVVNSTGALSVPNLLTRLGCEVIVINSTPNGKFAHDPEPLPKNLEQLSEMVIFHQADLGIAVDPDVDRLAFVCEDGSMFGEEYTLVAIADYVMSHKKGASVSNLSSTRALRDVSEKHGCTYHASAVGEVNVVTMMKETEAVIGGEGNGGVIYPPLHYGRDALVGIALFLSHWSHYGGKLSELRATYPQYVISKNKIELTPEIDLNGILQQLEEKYKHQPYTTIDGLKIEFEKSWVHLRKSNTEPIIRIYAEAETEEKANELAEKIKAEVQKII